MEKKKIKLNFADFGPDFNNNDNLFLVMLKKHFNVEITDDPDFLLYSCFGNDHLKYHCVRIFCTGECITPDFNLCDYAIGFDYINFEDRYCRIPLYMFPGYRSVYDKAKAKHEKADEIVAQPRDFCCMVCSGVTGRETRKEIFDLLYVYKPVASGGRWMNNVGGPVKDKLEFCSHYKFSIAFENVDYSGYTTEKIVESFAAGTIPIYFGDPTIQTEFNPKAFVNCAAFTSLQEAVEYIKYLDENDDAYMAMLREPMELCEKEDKLEDYLVHILSQEPEKAYRRPKNVWVANVEQNANRAVEQQRREKTFVYRLIRKIKRILRGIKTTH